MKIRSFVRVLLVVAALAATTVAGADIGGENVFTAGIGSSGSGGGAAFAVGYLRLSNAHNVVWGVDVAGEGVSLDSTGGNVDKPRRAWAFDFLLGGKLFGYSTGSGRIDSMFILGVREKSSTCPPSYLGYQCYADESPTVTYAVNYGAAITWSQENILLGMRVTGVSLQGLAGIRF